VIDPISLLDGLLVEAFAAAGLAPDQAYAVPCGRPEHGDFQCNGAIAGAKRIGIDPRKAAAGIASYLANSSAVYEASVAGPGFVNIRLSDDFLVEAARLQQCDPRLGLSAPVPQHIVLDFGGPNIAKPLHVGHLRSLVVGESLRRIFVAAGHVVVSDIHLGDWGLQMGMLISEMDIRSVDCGNDFTVDDLEQWYRTASAACKHDPARLEAARRATAMLQSGDPQTTDIWRRMRDASLAALRPQIDLLGAHFDVWNGESHSHPGIAAMVSDLVERGLATRSEGALVVHLDDASDPDPMPPLLLVKSDGAALYGTTDLATLRERAAEGAERIVYCVDIRQSLHFRQVFAAARKAGYVSDEVLLEHAGFGTVDGTDGKPLKTRDGGAPRLSALVEEAVEQARSRLEQSGMASEEAASTAPTVGIGALKFADLSGNRASSYVFDPVRMTAAEGRTGPYLQYACVRISSIAAKATEAGIVVRPMRITAPEERALVLACLGHIRAVATADRLLAPSVVAEHCFVLAQAFSRFYAACPVVVSSDPETSGSRLALAGLAGSVLGHGMHLLGIGVPARL
jgi:arginyl-tRNA synthetase